MREYSGCTALSCCSHENLDRLAQVGSHKLSSVASQFGRNFLYWNHMRQRAGATQKHLPYHAHALTVVVPEDYCGAIRYSEVMNEAQPKPRFPIAERSWRFAKAARLNWLERHQHEFNFALHMLGIPLAITGLILLFFFDWYWGAAAFVLGYLFQWSGHLVEGNDVGEFIVIKKALGLRTVAVSPKFKPEQNAE